MALKFWILCGVFFLGLSSCTNVADGAKVGEDGLDDTPPVTQISDQGSSMIKVSSSLQASSSSSLAMDIPVGESPVWGDSTAVLTIVEFGDFQCPYCAKIASTVDSLRSMYPTQIRWIYKHYPLKIHANARNAAAASMAAQNQGKFWEFYTAIATYNTRLSDDSYLLVAKELELDVGKFRTEMILDANKAARIDREIELGNKIGVTGTPSFFANGAYISRMSVATVKALLTK